MEIKIIAPRESILNIASDLADYIAAKFPDASSPSISSTLREDINREAYFSADPVRMGRGEYRGEAPYPVDKHNLALLLGRFDGCHWDSEWDILRERGWNTLFVGYVPDSVAKKSVYPTIPLLDTKDGHYMVYSRSITNGVTLEGYINRLNEQKAILQN